jgi:hypothetical protein
LTACIDWVLANVSGVVREPVSGDVAARGDIG